MAKGMTTKTGNSGRKRRGHIDPPKTTARSNKRKAARKARQTVRSAY